jgi:carboxymethylenebutenolidase
MPTTLANGKLCHVLWLTIALISTLATRTESQLPSAPDTVVVQSGTQKLHGLLYSPRGHGPFPAVLFTHGSWHAIGNPAHDRQIFERQSAALGPVFASHGYVFLFLFRKGAGLSADQGIHSSDLLDRELATKGRDARNRLQLKLLETDEMSDALSGLAFVRTLSYVDARRVAVVGHSFGGSLALLMAERDSTIAAVVDFSGGAYSWGISPQLRARLLEAVGRVRAPVFFIHAANDYSVAPANTLGAEMARLGKTHRVKIYPPVGRTVEEGHSFIHLRVGTWEPDVFAFLNESMR